MHAQEGLVDITRQLAHPANAVYAAWSQQEAQLAWGDPGDGWQLTFDDFRFAVGEVDVCRFGPVDGPQYLNRNRYLVLAPERQIVYATSLQTDQGLSFCGTVEVDLEPHQDGTRLRLRERGYYLGDGDSAEAHREGWESMLSALGEYLDARAG